MSERYAYRVIDSLTKAMATLPAGDRPKSWFAALDMAEDYLSNYDPTPWCNTCGGSNPAAVCKCGSTAENE
jgi:hypothetical protein